VPAGCAVAPYAHVTCIKELELGDGILERSALSMVNTRIGRPAFGYETRSPNPSSVHRKRSRKDLFYFSATIVQYPFSTIGGVELNLASTEVPM